jgi:hypothetical protein
MSIRMSHVTKGLLVVAAVVLTAAPCWAIYYALGPSKDDWGMKYNVEVDDSDKNNLDLTFTLDNEGRLKPIYKIELIAFSQQLDSQGGRSYDVMIPLKFEVKDGTRVAHVTLKKEFANRAHFRVLTQMVDGKRQPSGGSYHNIWVKKYWSNGEPDATPVADGAAPAPPSIATPRTSKVR